MEVHLSWRGDGQVVEGHGVKRDKEIAGEHRNHWGFLATPFPEEREKDFKRLAAEVCNGDFFFAGFSPNHAPSHYASLFVHSLPHVGFIGV